ncbi:MAG TPA: MFS transporter [Patescibacteria group bacterium]|nr:MFS transporter [Patescibacteria group bacterium]
MLMPQTQPKPQKFPALRHRDFRLIWFGQIISNTGSHMQIVALNWQIYLLTHSPVALGLIGLFRFLPIVVFSLIGGSFADAHNRKRILIISETLLAIFAVILAVTTFQGSITPTVIYAITICAAILTSFDMPARQAFVPSLVPKSALTNALSLNSIMWQIALIIGPTIAGFIIAHSGIEQVYILNAASYVLSTILLLFIRADGSIMGTPSIVGIAAIKEGLRFVKTRTMIWSTMLLDFFSTLLAGATALMPIFASDILHVGPQGLGFLYAAPAVGAVVAGYIIAHLGEIRKQGKVLLASVVLYAVGTILFGLSKHFQLSLLALFIIGAGDSISTIIRNTIRQISTPDAIRGRMTSINMIFFMGGPQLGEFEAGVLAAFVGAPMAVVTGGVGTLVVVGLMAAFIPSLRKYDKHTDEPLLS